VDLLARLAEDPSRAGLFLDVDGVLAPIVPRPEDAQVPEETRELLRRLGGRYALVACVSGRAGEDARRIVGVEEIVYVGNHGLELEPAAEAWRQPLERFLAEAAWPQTENKGLSAALHFRTEDDEAAARAALELIATDARATGLVARWGRKVLEILPPVEANKGTAVRRLLEERGLKRALYAGDDTTDLDGFDALAELELSLRVAVASPEGPHALRGAADLVVDDPVELRKLLESL
jgi:trehalose 6-phosphate phosphatase